jgi:hypothetical protein
MKSEKVAFDVVFSKKNSRELFFETVWAYTESRAREYLELAFQDFEEIISIDRHPEYVRRVSA